MPLRKTPQTPQHRRLGEWLKAARDAQKAAAERPADARRFSQAAVGRRVGHPGKPASRSTVDNWERGKTAPDAIEFLRLVRLLGGSLDAVAEIVLNGYDEPRPGEAATSSGTGHGG